MSLLLLFTGAATGAVVTPEPHVISAFGRYEPTLDSFGRYQETLEAFGRFEDVIDAFADEGEV